MNKMNLAAGCLVNLAANDANQVAITDADAVEPLVNLLGGGCVAYLAFLQAAAASALRHLAYKAMRDPLEAAFLEKLLAAELIASATDERPSPTDPRFVVDPEGTVRTAVAQPTEGMSSRVGDCVGQAVRRWSFPSSPGVTSVTYPFVFQSAH
mgnify:CR=1 FL=1